MNNHTVDRRHSKRLRTSIYEEDGDFQFMRGPKRAKTSEPPETPAPAAPVQVPVSASAATQPARRGRGRPPKAAIGPATATRSTAAAALTSSSSSPPPPPPASAPTRKGRSRKANVPVPVEEEEEDDELAAAAPKRPRRNVGALSDEIAVSAPEPAPVAQPRGRGRGKTAQKQAASLASVPINVQKEEKGKKAQKVADAEIVEEVENTTTRKATRRTRQPPAQLEAPSVLESPAPPPPPRQTKRKRPPPRAEPAQERVPEPEPEQVQERRAQTPQPEPKPESAPAQMELDSATPPAPATQADDQHDGSSVQEPERVALPISDTPVINRNKEMRKKAATKAGSGGGRRSSLGMRGRRASSLIENGHTALPHHEVDSADFYKHISADGLPEVRRMRVLLTWVGERNMPEKPPLGAANPHALLGARAIVKQVLKDLSTKGELTDWFSRDEGPKREVVMKPNPKNVEHEEKILELEDRVKRLRDQKKSWLALSKPPPEPTPLFPADDDAMFIDLPDESQIDDEDAETLRFLSDASNSAQALAATTKQRLSTVTSALGFRVDQLADGVQKVDMRVATAAREADSLLAMCADSLKRREEREKARAGTKNLPVMEVLRSLGRMLPPEGDTGSE